MADKPALVIPFPVRHRYVLDEEAVRRVQQELADKCCAPHVDEIRWHLWFQKAKPSQE